MISEFALLRLYEDHKQDLIRDSELRLAVADLVQNLSVFKKSDDLFSTNISILNESIEMLMDDDKLFKSVFPSGNFKFFKSEATRLVKKYEGVDFDVPTKSSDSIILLEKSQVGKTTKEDIFDAISEYERLFKAGFASPAEILTLSRFYPDRPEFQAASSKLPYEPMVIGGPASIEMVDKEGHLITTEALDDAFKKYMKNHRTRNIMVLHSDVQTGWALPAYINHAGQVFKSGVDDDGLYLISEVREDIKVAQKVKEQVESGKLRSYSIAGSALDVDQVNSENGKTIMRVNKLDLVETTICLAENSNAWTKTGLKKIQDIKIGEMVWTHRNRWRPVVKTFQRIVNENLIRITTESGSTLEMTSEHPVRTLIYGGQHIGTHYEWVEAKKLKVGDSVSTHVYIGKNCDFCRSPLFVKKAYDETQRRFCDDICKNSASGNRLGSTYESSLRRITKVQNPRLTGGYRTAEGRAKVIAANSSEKFKKMRSEVMKQLVQKYPERMIRFMTKGRQFRNRKYLTRPEQFVQAILPNVWTFSSYVEGKFPDFYDGDKKIIEVFGNYWHKPEDEANRKDWFETRGYECLVVWESEIKKSPAASEAIIREFIENKLSKIVKIETIPYLGNVYNLEVEEDNSYTTEACVTHNCERGINPGAHFDILKSHYHPETSCADGSCMTAIGMKITGEKDGKPFVAEIMEVAQKPAEEAGGMSFQPTGEVAMSGNEILKGSAVSQLKAWIQKNLKGKGFLLEDALEGNYKKRVAAHEADIKRLGMPEDKKEIVDEAKPNPKKFYEPGKVAADGQIDVKKSCS